MASILNLELGPNIVGTGARSTLRHYANSGAEIYSCSRVDALPEKRDWPGIFGGSPGCCRGVGIATGLVVMTTNFQSLKVMVVDDSKTIRRTAETLLTKVGCTVVTAVDGFDALAKIADNKPDIIFVDIMMPRLDGYQTCALIKNNSEFKRTPVIMLSSKDGLFDKAKGRIVGSDQYLTKPFSKNELLGAIEAHVGRAEQSSLAVE